MATIEQDVIDDIVRHILNVARPTRIILFGSAASGGMTGDSDIDLLVVEDNPADVLDEAFRLREALGDMPYPFDVVVMPAHRFEESKSVIGGLAYPANKYGRVIYEAA